MNDEFNRPDYLVWSLRQMVKDVYGMTRADLETKFDGQKNCRAAIKDCVILLQDRLNEYEEKLDVH